MLSKLDLSTDIKVYPYIVDNHKAGALWSLCRGVDKIGSGKVSFTMVEMTSVLGVSERTIFRYLSTNLFFTREEVCNKPNKDYSHYNFHLDKYIYHVNKNDEMVYTIYYKSMRTILEILCFEGDVIPASYITPLDLHKTRKRVVATEIMVELGQNSSLML